MSNPADKVIEDITSYFKGFLSADAAECSPEGLVLKAVALILHRQEEQSSFLEKMDQTLFERLEEDVADFNIKMKLGYIGSPRKIPKELAATPSNIMEEVKELYEAIAEGDLQEQYHAYLDIIYMTLSCMHYQGMPFRSGWKAIHASNMTKEATDMGKGKNGTTIIKGKDFIPPQLPILNEKTHNT